MDRTRSVVTSERFAQGMTFDEYVRYTATPENLAREAGWWLGRERKDLSGILRSWYAEARIGPAQTEAIRWLAAQPDGPARILVISEDWSSDCRRDVPMLQRLAEAGGLELRIFNRDGVKFGQGPTADPRESPNADIVNQFLQERDGQTFQSVPVAVFFTKDLGYLYHYIQHPVVHQNTRGRIIAAMQAPRPRESREEAWSRFLADWRALQQTMWPRVWASAMVDEVLCALHERIVAGPPA
jgi:thiol-disulfide isomerase/thioredoxin